MYKDLTGLIFGKLTVIQQVESQRHVRRWLCRCSCGNTSTVSTADLTSGNTTSCGCNKNKSKHGKAGTRIYRIYQYMLQRCHRFNDPLGERPHRKILQITTKKY